MTSLPDHHQFKITYEKAAGHVHYTIYVRKPPTETWAQSGNGALQVNEFIAFATALGNAVTWDGPSIWQEKVT